MTAIWQGRCRGWFGLLAVAWLAALTCTIAGCRSNKLSIAAARHAYASGDFDTAAKQLHRLSEGPRPTRRPSQLDLAIVELAAGQPEAAESRLRDLRDHFDSLGPSAALNDAASLAIDDTARTFQIAAYEQVLLRSLLAICSLAQDGTDAEAYCLQAQSRQQELDRMTARQPDAKDAESSATNHRIALAPYLRGTLREATHQNYDDAERAFRLVSSLQPDFLPAAEDIVRAHRGSHSRSGHGVVFVLAFVGRGPRLIETVAPTTTTSLQIASMLLRANLQGEEGQGDQPVLPNVASVKVPGVEVPPGNTVAIGVGFEGQLLGATQTITDVGQLAVERVEAEMPWTIARAVARRVLKETSVAATSKSLGLSGDAAAAFEFAAINAWSASERADTRCWGLLPREIQVLRAELPVGPQEIDLTPMGISGGFLADPEALRIEIEDGRNHYILVVAPERIISVVP